MEDEMTKLTEMEMAVIALVLNYDNREDQHSDNFSNADVAEVMKQTGWSRHQVAGVLSSLSEKRVAQVVPEDGNLIWLSTNGIDVYFDNLEAAA
jgi:hypothetical protein